MSIAELGREATFGAGGAEPYAHALRREGRLTLVRSDAGGESSGSHGEGSTEPSSDDYDLGRWMAAADDVDRALLAAERGPVLDIGCGPGRMVEAGIALGLVALGIDVSPAAVAVARNAGLPVLRRTVFERLPRERHWGTALLLDGNIGIGGDPVRLLNRCRELLSATGAVIVEASPRDEADSVFSAHVVDDHGRASSDFPWAEVGADAMARHAASAGLRVDQEWRIDGRVFARLIRA